MNSPRKSSREFWLFAVLLTVFLGIAFYAEQTGQAVVAHTSPSSLNARPQGSKALYAVFQTLPFTIHRLTTPWNTLGDEDGLLVVIEKLDAERQPTTAEVTSLRHWTERGGTVLYFVTDPPRPLDPRDTLAGDIAIVGAAADPISVAPTARTSPYTRQVTTITAADSVRLLPAPNTAYETLFQDSNGIVAAQKPLGKGHVILVADTHIVSNQGIREADNVVFLANIAQTAVGNSKRAIQFDEFHHGVGFDTAGATTQTWISTLPTPIKYAAWPFLVLLLLLIFNGNQRFGVARALPIIPYRPSTDYVHSLARWFRRAEATDIVLQTLVDDFRRVLSQHLDAPPDLSTPELLHRANERFPQNAVEWSQIIQQGERIAAGNRVGNAEMLEFARRMEHAKRRLQVVGDH